MAAQCRFSFSVEHVLKTFCYRGALNTRVNPDTIGCVWTGEFDLNTLRVNGKIYEFRKKKLRIQKYIDRYGRDLSGVWRKRHGKFQFHSFSRNFNFKRIVV